MEVMYHIHVSELVEMRFVSWLKHLVIRKRMYHIHVKLRK